MKTHRPGLSRAISLVLALVVVLSLPVSAFATTQADEADSGISPLAYDYNDIPEKMLDNSILRALAYLGYDVDFLKSEGTLYKYTASRLLEQYPSKFPCPVPYCTSGLATGLQTSSINNSCLDVVSPTGKYPDVNYFATGGTKGSKYAGLDCVDFVAYYLTNYLPNIEGVDIKWLDEILAKYPGFTYDDMYFWPEAQEDLAAAGVKIWEVESVDYQTGKISKYTTPNGEVRTGDIYSEFEIGTIIQMGNEKSEVVHYAVYAGTYDGQHYMIHSGNSDRGPEISIIEYMSLYSRAGKKSVPLYFYEFPIEEQYGSIEIYKDDPNGKPLAGAVFYVRNNDTGEDYMITTDKTGYARLSEISLGTYTIFEDEAPAGYEKVDTVWTVKLTKENPNGGGTIHVTNTLITGSLQIEKITEDDKNYEGWEFALYADEGCTVLAASPAITDVDGSCLFEGLKPGTYWVKELGHEDPAIDALYHCAGENPQMVEVKADEESSVLFENELNRGDLEIIKKGNNQELLSGAKFQVKDASGQTYTVVERTTGHYFVINVPYGTYTITEITPPPGYKIGEQDTWTVTLDQSSPNAKETITIVNNELPGDLFIQKHTEDDKNYEGWEFALYADEGCTVLVAGPAITDVDGYCLFEGLKPGTYWVKELGHEDPAIDALYHCAGENPQMVEVKADEESSVLFENKLNRGDLEIQKETNTGADKDGWKVNVYFGSVAEENLLPGSPFTTDENGKILLKDLPIGTYIAVEVDDGKEMWIYDLEEKTAEVPTNGTGHITITNKQFGHGLITKTTVNGGSAAGWQFKVWTDAAELGIFTTGDNGELDLGLLPHGTYYVQEVGHEAYDLRYWIMDSEVRELTIGAGKTSSVSFENVWMGELVIDKQLVNSDLLAGWIGDLYLVNPDGTETKIGTYTSDENGIFTKLLVVPGHYVFRETGHVDSSVGLKYWVMADALEIEVSAGSTATATVINTELGNAQIVKNTTNGGIKAGWQFNVWSDSMETITVTTNANGEYDLGLLAPGIYYVQEIGHETMTAEQLAYWIMDAEIKTFVVEVGSTSSVQFENQWLGYGQIIKEMPDGGSVAGWIFDVYRVSDNTYIGEFTSEENGNITLGYLLPGDYRVIERVPVGSLYQPVGGNEKILTVVAGEVSSLTVRNVLLSGEIILNKVDSSDNKALAGAKFLLEWLDGEVWKPVIQSDTIIPGGCRSDGLVNGCLVTDANGQAIYEGLHPNLEYRLTEIEAPDGYTLLAAPVFEGKLPADTLSESVTAYNSAAYIPNTGDDSMMFLTIMGTIMVVCTGAMIFMIIRGIKRRAA